MAAEKTLQEIINPRNKPTYLGVSRKFRTKEEYSFSIKSNQQMILTMRGAGNVRKLTG